VLSGLVGLRAHATHLEISPVSLSRWFAATRVKMHGVEVSVVWDAAGHKYGLGAGLHVWINGRHVGSAMASGGTDGGRSEPSQLSPPRLRVSWEGARLVVCQHEHLSAEEVEAEEAGVAPPPWERC
jgi:hypothetical protein